MIDFKRNVDENIQYQGSCRAGLSDHIGGLREVD
jgi:hypothetical protein